MSGIKKVSMMICGSLRAELMGTKLKGRTYFGNIVTSMINP